MRPVNRGNSTTYNPPSANINAELQFLQDDVLLTQGGQTFDQVCEQEAAAVMQSLIGRNIIYADPRQPVPLPPNYTDLIGARANLKSDFTNALSTGASAARLVQIAQQLIAVLRGLVAYYDSAVEAYNNRIKRVYTLARRDLIANIGQYCSYCEMPLAASLAVEHMLPKKWFPRYATDWVNFLLACPNCNGIKSARPSISDGINAAGGGSPNFQQVVDGALGLYLWPSDVTNYPSFDLAFQYYLFKILYNSKGELYDSVNFTINELVLVIQQGRIKKISQTGGDIKAQVLTPLFSLAGQGAVPVISNLQSLNQRIAITNANVNNIQALAQAFNSFTNANLPNVNNFRVNLGVDPNVYITPLGPQRWSLEQTNTYMIYDNGGTITLYAADGSSQLANWSRGTSTIMRLILDAGNLPDEIATQIGVDKFSVSVTFISTDQRGRYWISVGKNYELVNYNGILSVYADQVFSLELWLTSVGDRRATELIKNVKLNKNSPLDPKQSDRRLPRRTNTLLNALEVVQNLQAAQMLSPQTYPTIVNDLMRMVVQTAQLSGFWTVWYEVLRGFLSLNSPVQIQLLQELRKTNNFPGTR